jgi:hypothetical protein
MGVIGAIQSLSEGTHLNQQSNLSLPHVGGSAGSGLAPQRARKRRGGDGNGI